MEEIRAIVSWRTGYYLLKRYTRGSGAESASYGGPSERQGPRVQIIVNGHIAGQSGFEELTDMINEAVEGRDVRLVSSQVKRYTRVGWKSEATDA